jgi:glycosyltransferase involved in cell wall biosynthesis
MSSSIRVFVSHPGKQGNVYQRPRAAEQAGCTVTFLTGLYYFPERFPYSFVKYLRSPFREKIQKELEKRRQEGLSPDNVVSLLGPMLETILRPRGLLREWGAIHDWMAGAWLRRRQLGAGPSIVHCFQDSALRTLQATRRNGVVRILEVTLPPVPQHECEAIAEGASRFKQLQLRAAERLRRELEHAEWAVAQSAYSVRSIASLGFARDRILCIPLGVDTRVFKPQAARSESEPAFRALFVGTIGRRKGVHHLLRAWRQLQLRDAELVIVGDKETPEARELLDGSGENVRAVGNVSFERLLEEYHDADVLIHASLAEGGCNVVHEALACGLPCVVSANATSAVRDGVEGYVVPVANTRALGERIAELYASPDLRIRMSRAARQRAEDLSWEAYVERLGNVYLELGRGASVIPAEARTDTVFGANIIPC